VLDSGASHHCTPDLSHFHTFASVRRSLMAYDGKPLPVLGVGTVWLRAEAANERARTELGEEPLIELREVLWVPEAAANLISVSKAMASGARLEGAQLPGKGSSSFVSLILERHGMAIKLTTWSQSPHDLYTARPPVAHGCVVNTESHLTCQEPDLRPWEWGERVRLRWPGNECHNLANHAAACPARVERHTPIVPRSHAICGH